MSALVIIGTLVTCNAWARLGETAEQAEARYGPPTKRMYGALPVKTNEITGTVNRHYSKGEMNIYADYFTNKSGVSVIGQISYSSQSYIIPDELRQQLFNSNGNGETWDKQQVGMSWCWKTKNAMAEQGALGGYIFSLYEYTDLIKATEAEYARKKAEQLKKDQEGF